MLISKRIVAERRIRGLRACRKVSEDAPNIDKISGEQALEPSKP